MFKLSNLFEAPAFEYPGLANPDIYPTTRSSKSIRQNTNALMAEHYNKWESVRNIKGTVVGVINLPFLSLGAIISLESGVESNKRSTILLSIIFPSALVLIS
jgi:hypothetical protein